MPIHLIEKWNQGAMHLGISEIPVLNLERVILQNPEVRCTYLNSYHYKVQ